MPNENKKFAPLYHKIQSLFHRDPETNYKTFLRDTWSRPEFSLLRDVLWEATEKIDGTNIRVIWDVETETVEFRGRTDKAQLHPELVAALEAMFPSENFSGMGNTVLYGEGYGAGIQKVGVTYRSDKSFVLFDALSEKGWYRRDYLEELAEELGISVVPVVYRGTLLNLEAAVREGVNGFPSTLHPEAQSEGFVCRPLFELQDGFGKRIITKMKVKDYQNEK